MASSYKFSNGNTLMTAGNCYAYSKEDFGIEDVVREVVDLVSLDDKSGDDEGEENAADDDEEEECTDGDEEDGESVDDGEKDMAMGEVDSVSVQIAPPKAPTTGVDLTSKCIVTKAKSSNKDARSTPAQILKLYKCLGLSGDTTNCDMCYAVSDL